MEEQNKQLSPTGQPNVSHQEDVHSIQTRINITPDVIQNYLYGKRYIKYKCRGSDSICGENGYCHDFSESIFSSHYEKQSPSLPKQFTIDRSTIPGETWGVFTTSWIKEGTQMGPFTGRLIGVNHINMDVLNELVWEVFDACGSVKFFVEAGLDCHRTWVHLIKCARSDQEQNLDLMQQGSRLLYRANKDIPPNQELLVWYNNTVNQFLGIPDVKSETEQTRWRKGIERNGLPFAKDRLVNGRLRCTVCRRGFNSRSNLRSHMRIHTMERPFQCKYCKKCFSQSSTLRNHTRLHTGEKPYQCNVCHMAYSQLAGLRAHQKSARHRPEENHVALNDISMVLGNKYRNDESCYELPTELTFATD